MKNMYNEADVVQLLDSTALAHTDQTSDIIDVHGAEGIMILCQIGALTGVDSSNYVVPTLQESDSTATGTFTAVAAADMIRQDGTAAVWEKIDDGAEYSCTIWASYIGQKRYVRVLFDTTSAGTYPTGNVAVIAVLTHAAVSPPSFAVTATT